MVLVVRWFSPGVAAAWAFALGVMLDSLGGGPLGVHAAIFVLMTTLLPRFGFAKEHTSAWRWLWAAFLTAWCDGAIMAAVELLPQHHVDAFEQRLVVCAIASAVTATAMGLWVGTWRVITRA
jgi:rod shape-determining protein MreD